MMLREIAAGLALLGAYPAITHSQGIPEYPKPQITVAQWQAYLDAVKAAHGVKCEQADPAHLACELRAPAENINVRVPVITLWLFTTGQNPAHPALVERRGFLGPKGFESRNKGHYAGTKSSFDRWYSDFEVWARRSDEAWSREAAKARSYTPKDWETQAIEKVMLDLWAARELGQVDRTYAHVAPVMREQISREEWNRRGAEFRQEAGPVKSRRITGVRWYRELPGSATPGIYAQVTVTGAFQNVAAYNARLTFRGMDDGSFRLVKEDERYGDTPEVAKLPEIAVEGTAQLAKSAAAPQAPAAKAVTAARPAAPSQPANRTTSAGAKGAGIPQDRGGQITPARYAEYLAAVRAISDVKCERDSFRQLICDSQTQNTVWFFTVAGHTAHPAVVQKREVAKAGKTSTERIGHFAGSRQEFDLWFGQFEELDE
jgi:hypothetical protein